MLRSFSTAINALLSQQVAMDVLADNLSNVTTPGFKANSVSFKDQFSQTLRAGAAPTEELGGINPTQVGLGTNVGAILQRFSQGALSSTGRDLDLAVQGDGFFVYKVGIAQYYSRDGSLATDKDGFIVNSSTGDRIQGWQADPATGEVSAGINLEAIQIPIDNTVARQTTVATMLGNLDSTIPEGTDATLTNLGIYLSDGTVGGATDDPRLPVVADRHYASIGVYDSLGSIHTTNVRYIRLPNTTDPTTGETLSVWRFDAVSPTSDLGRGLLYFNTSGQFVRSEYADPTTISNTGDTTATLVAGTVDQPALLQVAGSPGSVSPFTYTLNVNGLTTLATNSTATLATQDGLAAGTLVTFNVSANTGEIFGVYTNGDQRLIGQLAMAMFTNPSGLMRMGSNRYQVSLNSGEARIGTPGSGGRGKISAGYVEGSNVDMSREFSNMIIAQRGFQANAKIITVSDEMLNELVNLKR